MKFRRTPHRCPGGGVCGPGGESYPQALVCGVVWGGGWLEAWSPYSGPGRDLPLRAQLLQGPDIFLHKGPETAQMIREEPLHARDTDEDDVRPQVERTAQILEVRG
jgi:hypothetical protein